MTTTPTTEASILTTLPIARARIAELRHQRCHVTAGIMRDEMLSQLEAWLDPDGTAHTRELQAEQGKHAGALALQVDDYCGF
jgi:hypothetical protein